MWEAGTLRTYPLCYMRNKEKRSTAPTTRKDKEEFGCVLERDAGLCGD